MEIIHQDGEKQTLVQKSENYKYMIYVSNEVLF